MNTFSTAEIARAEEIIAAGLNKAAESLSFFMKENISLRETNFDISTKYNNQEFESKQLYVLSTELKGGLKGVCYLVFTEDESNEICKVALPPQIWNDKAKLSSMKEPLLLEVDNILSAAVVTQFANQLKIKVYGDVPFLNIHTEESLNNLINVQLHPDKLIMGFRTEFNSLKSNFHPEFFWILEPDFMENVRQTLITQQ